MENIKIIQEIRSIEGDKVCLYIPTEIESKLLYDPKQGRKFIESIKHSSFVEALQNAGDNLMVCLEHNSLVNLGKEVSFEEAEGGVNIIAKLQGVTNELRQQINDGQYGVSFAMQVEADNWKQNGSIWKRIIEKLSLSEVSLVNNPAYRSSMAEMRSYEAFLESEQKAIAEAYLYVAKAKVYKL
ncbi:HK97 family phage prohead protease [Cytobacillus oceanisediminis]|uniref:HK97 family phage prohead protease n=1 Tax=Cytobacillus oceanisediminis TaxID=665099 RepID=UPI001CCC2578|nr:HK97 family phage prohead protease [Cytobacillus oceanisediminis]MBZ9535947.1 HK97 family phage prohead protease [Cytobacillus oceanisediminis]